MRIGVISDTHGCASVWQQIMNNYFSNVDMIIHAGDILYHGPRNPIMDGYDPPMIEEKAISILDIDKNKKIKTIEL